MTFSFMMSIIVLYKGILFITDFNNFSVNRVWQFLLRTRQEAQDKF